MFDLWVGGEGPSELPQWAYSHLVTVLNVETVTMMDLKCVQQMDYVGGVLVNLIRIFDLKVEGLVAIEDFSSLDRRPELILFEGYLEKTSERVEIVSRRAPAGGPVRAGDAAGNYPRPAADVSVTKPRNSSC